MKYERNRERKGLEEYKIKRRSNKYGKDGNTEGDCLDYGPNNLELIGEESENEIWKKCLEFYNSRVLVAKEKIVEIREVTKDQNDNQLWLLKRRKRITCSIFGTICKMRKSTSRQNLVYEFLYANKKEVTSIIYGKKYEPIARSTYESNYNLKIELTGL